MSGKNKISYENSVVDLDNIDILNEAAKLKNTIMLVPQLAIDEIRFLIN
jgi:hypothetical protein